MTTWHYFVKHGCIHIEKKKGEKSVFCLASSKPISVNEPCSFSPTNLSSGMFHCAERERELTARQTVHHFLRHTSMKHAGELHVAAYPTTRCRGTWADPWSQGQGCCDNAASFVPVVDLDTVPKDCDKVKKNVTQWASCWGWREQRNKHTTLLSNRKTCHMNTANLRTRTTKTDEHSSVQGKDNKDEHSSLQGKDNRETWTQLASG